MNKRERQIRNRDVVAMATTGRVSLEQLASIYGLTRQGVSYILKAEGLDIKTLQKEAVSRSCANGMEEGDLSRAYGHRPDYWRKRLNLEKKPTRRGKAQRTLELLEDESVVALDIELREPKVAQSWYINLRSYLDRHKGAPNARVSLWGTTITIHRKDDPENV